MLGSDVGGGGACPTPLYWSFVLHLFQYPPPTHPPSKGDKKFDKCIELGPKSPYYLSSYALEHHKTKTKNFERGREGEMEVEIQPSSAVGMVVSLIYSNLLIPSKHLL